MMHPSQAEEFAAAALADYQQGHFQQAVQGFRQARELLLGANLLEQAAEMANNAAVALLQLDQPEAAIEILEGTPQVFANAGNDRLQAQALGNQAAALEALGNRHQAEELYQRALVLFREVGDQESQAFTLQGLSRVQLKDGRALQALDSMQASLEAKPRRGLTGRVIRRLLSLPARFLNR
jgi:tetratricopeptide (TPR) repeat protein